MKYKIGTLLKLQCENFKAVYEIIKIKDGKYILRNHTYKVHTYDYVNSVDNNGLYELLTDEDKLELL